ncbi:MAG: hypothetical protein V1899_00120 [Planctomycetota bacterium]
MKLAAETLDTKIKKKKDAAYSGKMREDEKAAGVVCFPLTADVVLPWYAVPSEAQAGLYKGQVNVTVGGKKAAEFELELEVLPFTLTDNGCRWGAFQTPNPGQTSDAWCDLNSRYGFNSFAWWNLDDPKLNWTWNGLVREELVLAKLRNDKDEAWTGPGKQRQVVDPEQKKFFFELVQSFSSWLKKRQDGPFFVFKPSEVVGLPEKIEDREPFYKKQLQLKPELGVLTEEQAKSIRYDRSSWTANFDEKSIETVQFEQNDAFRKFDEGMQRIKKHGFAGPVTWFGSGGPPNGEYWTYSLIYSVVPSFGGARFAMGFKGVRHFSALSYSYADSIGVQNLAPETDIMKSGWITGDTRTNYYLAKDPKNSKSVDHAIASHAMLAIRQGITDRKYAETLRVLAHQKNSAADIAYVKELGAKAEAVGVSSAGGYDNFTDDVKDESAAQKLRREIADRIKALAGQ